MKRSLQSAEFEAQKEATGDLFSHTENRNGFLDAKAAILNLNDRNGYKHQKKHSLQTKKLPHFLQVLMNNSKYVELTPAAGGTGDCVPKCYYCEIPLENDDKKLRCCKCMRYSCHLMSGCSIRDKNNSLFCLECFSAA